MGPRQGTYNLLLSNKIAAGSPSPEGPETSLQASQAFPELTHPSAQSPAVLTSPGDKEICSFLVSPQAFPFPCLGCRVLSPPHTGQGTCWRNPPSGRSVPLQPPGGCPEHSCDSAHKGLQQVSGDRTRAWGLAPPWGP